MGELVCLLVKMPCFYTLFYQINCNLPRNKLALLIVILTPWKQRNIERSWTFKRKEIVYRMCGLVCLLVKMQCLWELLYKITSSFARNKLVLIILTLRPWKKEALS